MDNLFSQANLNKAEAFLQTDNGKKAEEFIHQKTGIDVAQYASKLPGGSSTSQSSGQQTQNSNQDHQSSNNTNDSTQEPGNYPENNGDLSTSEGGYGGNPFSRSAQTGGDDPSSRGQFGGNSQQETSAEYRGGEDSQNHSRSGSEYGGASGTTTPFKTGGFSSMSNNNDDNQRNGDSDPNIGA